MPLRDVSESILVHHTTHLDGVVSPTRIEREVKLVGMSHEDMAEML